MIFKKPKAEGPAFNTALRVNSPLHGEDTCIGRNFRCILITGMFVAGIGLLVTTIILLVRKYG